VQGSARRGGGSFLAANQSQQLTGRWAAEQCEGLNRCCSLDYRHQRFLSEVNGMPFRLHKSRSTNIDIVQRVDHEDTVFSCVFA